ncbi:ABC transporter permease [Salinispora fenicalii]|uniref:ABC transporter permease n=1 Tax=Salinispora fenicalii TaxID=1137263 RepID=UPI00047FFD33|nr:ABC transporter permease [Salinispora fenicalii]
MLRLTLRQVRADGRRLLLSSLAVVLGVAFVAGTLISIDGMHAGAYARAGAFDRHTDLAAYARAKPLAPSLVERVREVDGVAAADGELTGIAEVVGSDGRPVLGHAMLAAIPTDPALQSYDMVAGRLPRQPGEVVLDDATVVDQGFTLGAPVRIGGSTGPSRSFTLVGTVDVAGTTRDIGRPYVGLADVDALAVTGKRGYGRIMVAARPGADLQALTDRIRTTIGPGVTVKDRQAILDDEVAGTVGSLRQFTLFLMTFAVVAVVVAGFVIANTFAIVLAQRTRRTALLRLVGATRGQVFRAALAEAALTGLLASAAGLLAGIGVAAGLGVLLPAVTEGAPVADGITVTARTVLLCLGLGTLLTMVAAALPAWQGTRVAPVAALTNAAVQPARRAGRIRLTAGALAGAAGVAALVGTGKTGQIPQVAVGGVLAFLGIVLLGPVLVPALVQLLSWPARRLFGATAELAVANAVRNPRRIAATTTATVIGISLVSAFVVGAASAKVGIERAVDAQYGVDFLVQAGGDELPAPLAGELAARPELDVVHEQRSHVVDGVELRAAHPALVRRTLTAVDAGDPAGLGPGTVLVHRELAAARGWTVGSTVTLAGQPFRVAAVVDGLDSMAVSSVLAGHVVDVADADFARLFPTERGYLAEVAPADGVSPATARAAIESVLANYPTVNLADQGAYKKMLTGTVDLALTFVTALLGLAVMIALVGVANTLSLSVVERTRENALLRAVGLTRGGMRAVLAVEAALTAQVGTLLGIALGTGVAASAMATVTQLGVDFTLVLPWGRLGLVVAVVLLAALAASLQPARRALAPPVVEALGAE